MILLAFIGFGEVGQTFANGLAGNRSVRLEFEVVAPLAVENK